MYRNVLPLYKRLLAGTIVFFCLVIVSFVGFRCSHPETVMISEPELVLPRDSSAIFRSDKRYFVLVPGDTALFGGTKACTLLVNGIIQQGETSFDSLYFRTITLDTKTETFGGTSYTVYPQKYQYGPSISKITQDETVRYFTINDTATLQLAYEYKGKQHLFAENKQKVFPRLLDMGKFGWFQSDTTTIPTTHKWSTSPLIRQPLRSNQGTLSFVGYTYAPEAIAYPVSPKQISSNPYKINGIEFKNGSYINSVYSLEGEITEDDEIVNVHGAITIKRTYFVDRGLVDQSLHSAIRKDFSNGTTELRIEQSYIARIDTARIFDETVRKY